MAKQENIAVMEKVGQAINDGNFEVLKQALTGDVKDHDAAPDQGPGPEGMVRFFRAFRAAVPDLAVAVDHTVADEENIAMAYTITGTHKGTFQGVAPTGKKIHARGVQIARFDQGKIAERWGSSDELGILKQIGVAVKSGSVVDTVE